MDGSVVASGNRRRFREAVRPPGCWPSKNAKLIRGAISLAGIECGFAKPQASGWQGLAAGKALRELVEGFPGVLGLPEPELGCRAVGQGVIRHASRGVLAQVLVERSDGLGESAFLDVFLTDQELGLGTGRTRCRSGQAREHRIGPVGLSRAAIGKRKIVTGRRAGGVRKACWPRSLG